jgi:hypothetical protein
LTADELAGMVRLLRKARGELIVTVEGCSMEPLFRGPTRVRVACGNSLETLPGSLVLFVSEHARLIAHRVIASGKSGKYLLTRGDNNFSIDRPVPVHSVLGVIEGPADTSPSLNWDQKQSVSGITRRLDIAAARRSFRVAWVIASVTIFVESTVRNVLRLVRTPFA